MERIFPPNHVVEALLGKKKEKPVPYVLTQYCLRVTCEDGELLYNTLTGELLLIPGGETIEQNRAELIRRHFFVEKSTDEFAIASEVLRVLLLMQPRDGIIDRFLIYPTTDCNARCYYCYEIGRPRETMTDQTADDVVDYMLRVSGDHKIYIRWFGGEPLYNARAIDRILSGLRAAGRDYWTEMTTNGYLFDEDLVQTAVRDWHLTGLQIVLDGTEQVYNRAKAFIYKDDPSPYRRVIRNIGLLLDAGVTVDVRLNLGVNNFEDLIKLAQELGDRFKGREKLGVYVALLHDFGTSPQGMVDDDERLRRWRELTGVLHSYGLVRRFRIRKKPRLYNCMADEDNNVTILPDGSIGKCEHENKEEIIGSIYGGELDRDRIAAWKEHVESPSCRECELFPRCRRLKKCAWTDNDCLPINRAIMRDRLADQVRYTYEHRDGPQAKPTDGFEDSPC